MIIGNKVTLKPFEAEDSERFRIWINSADVLEFAQFRLPVNELGYLHWYESISGDSSRVFFSCYDNSDMSHKACVWLENIDRFNAKAECIVVSENTESYIEEYLIESVQLLTKYAFNYLNLNKLYYNLPLSKIFYKNIMEKAGFKSEAVLKEEIFINGRYEDLARMAILKNIPRNTMPQSIRKDDKSTPEVQWFHSAKPMRK